MSLAELAVGSLFNELFLMPCADLQDGSSCPPSPESDEVSVDAAPKDKKSGPSLRGVCVYINEERHLST